MTKLEFAELQLKFNTREMTLKTFLKSAGVVYSMYAIGAASSATSRLAADCAHIASPRDGAR